MSETQNPPQPHQIVASSPADHGAEQIWLSAQRLAADIDLATKTAAVTHLAAAARHLLDRLPTATVAVFRVRRGDDPRLITDTELRAIVDHADQVLWDWLAPADERVYDDEDFEWAEERITESMRLTRTHFSFPGLKHIEENLFQLQLR